VPPPKKDTLKGVLDTIISFQLIGEVVL